MAGCAPVVPPPPDTGTPDVADVQMIDAQTLPDVQTPDVPVVDSPVPVDVPEVLTPGSFLSPLVRMQRLQGLQDHLHVDEVRYRESDGRLFQCSYTFGVLNASNPQRMSYLAQNLTHVIPGDTRRPGCIHLAADGNIVYTTHRGNIRNPTFLGGWDVTPNAMGAVTPTQIPVLQEPGVSYEGVDVANGHVYVGLHAGGLGVYDRDATTNALTRVGSVTTGLTDAWGIHARGNTVFVADGAGGLVTVDVTTPTMPRVLGAVATGGLASGLVVEGNFAYVAAGAAGLVVVDISDLAAPRVISRTAMPGTAIRVAYSMGRVFVAAWNDARVYDVSMPAAPRLIGAVRLTVPVNYPEADRPQPTSRILGIAASGDNVFVGNWHVLYSYKLFAARLAPNIRLPEEAAQMDFGVVPVGMTRTVPLAVTNQGTAPLTLINVWGTGPFTVTPNQIRIAPGASTTLQITYRATATTQESGFVNILSDDPENPIRRAFVLGNQPGVGVGRPLPETRATLLDGTPWNSTETRGNVLLLTYFATF